MDKSAKTNEKPSVMLQPEVVEENSSEMVEESMTSQAPVESLPPVEESTQPEIKNDDVWGKFPPHVDGGNRSKPSKGLMWLVILLVAITVTVLGLVAKSILSKGDGIRTIISNETPTPTQEVTEPTATPSPTPEITDKEEVMIQVLNGSGVTGQASKVATQIKALGFSDVDAGNGEDNAGATQVAYSSKIDQAFVKEVVAALEETFDQVESAVDDTLEDYHIVITTGSGSE